MDVGRGGGGSVAVGVLVTAAADCVLRRIFRLEGGLLFVLARPVVKNVVE